MSSTSKEVKIGEKRKLSTDEETSKKDKIDYEFIENSNRQAEELHFSKLFHRVLDIIVPQMSVADEEIKNSAWDIVQKFRSHDLMKVDFNLPKNLCAYFYRYSTLNAAVARHRFFHAFKNCEELKKCIEKSTINVISLGGGSGTDMIGLCSVIQGLIGDTNKTLNLTTADVCKRWASFYHLNEYFIREGDFGNISTLFQHNNICSTFMTVDLRNESPPAKYLCDLKKADLVLLVRVFDCLNFNEVKPNDIFKELVSRMKGGAFLLLIDSSVNNYNDNRLQKIYMSDLPEFELTVPQEIRYSTNYGKSTKAQIAVFQKKDIKE